MAPAVVVVIAWTRPGGTLVDALRRSLPLGSSTPATSSSGRPRGRPPPGPYHQQLSTQAVDNLFSLIFQTDGLGRTSLQLQTLEDLLLIAFLGATLVVSLARHNYLVLGGILWFLLGTVPVLFLVHHAQQPYYVDFALPGIALAIGAGIDQLAAVWSTTVAVAVGVVLVAVIAVVGHVASDFEFTHEFGADITETNRLVAQVEAAYPNRPSGADLIVVHSDRIAHDEQLVTRNGDLFRVEYGDPFPPRAVRPLTRGPAATATPSRSPRSMRTGSPDRVRPRLVGRARNLRPAVSRRAGRRTSRVRPRRPPGPRPAAGARDRPTRASPDPAVARLTSTSVSSPLPGAWTTVTPPPVPASTPRRAAPSRTTTTGS